MGIFKRVLNFLKRAKAINDGCGNFYSEYYSTKLLAYERKITGNFVRRLVLHPDSPNINNMTKAYQDPGALIYREAYGDSLTKDFALSNADFEEAIKNTYKNLPNKIEKYHFFFRVESDPYVSLDYRIIHDLVKLVGLVGTGGFRFLLPKNTISFKIRVLEDRDEVVIYIDLDDSDPKKVIDISKTLNRHSSRASYSDTPENRSPSALIHALTHGIPSTRVRRASPTVNTGVRPSAVPTCAHPSPISSDTSSYACSDSASGLTGGCD